VIGSSGGGTGWPPDSPNIVGLGPKLELGTALEAKLCFADLPERSRSRASRRGVPKLELGNKSKSKLTLHAGESAG